MKDGLNVFRDGMNIGELIKNLKVLNPKLPVIISSDEEQNTLFRGFYLDVYGDGLIIAGLSGRELEVTK